MTIEPYEVRFEILASGEAITRLLEFPLSTPDIIEVSEQDALKEKAIEELDKALREQEDRVEEKRKVLNTIVETRLLTPLRCLCGRCRPGDHSFFPCT